MALSHRLHRFSQNVVACGCVSRGGHRTGARAQRLYTHSIKIFPARRRACRSCGRFTFAIRASRSASERTRSIASNPTSETFCARSHFKNRPALKRDWQAREVLPPKDLHVLESRSWLSIHLLLRAAIVAVRQMFWTDVAAKHFLQIRNDAMANAVAKRIEILVRCVLAKSQPMLAHIVVDLFAPDTRATAARSSDRHRRFAV